MHLESDPNTKKWQFGSEIPEINNKVIMMIGESGPAKTTLVNALVNYMFGVQWKYDCRVRLIAEEDPVMTQDPDQESKVKVYQINHCPNFYIPYSLTIIDTPGLLENQGQKMDNQQIRQLFYDSELDHIDAICFVTQPSMSALSPTQKFVFDSLSAMFGSKIQDNIVTFMTSTEDDQRPPALATNIHDQGPCDEDQLYHSILFKFNINVLYANNSPDVHDAKMATEQQWNLGMENINNFFQFLAETSRVNIVLPKDNPKLSKAIEITVDGMGRRIEEVMAKLHELDEIENNLREHEVEIEKNESFEFEVHKQMKTKVRTMANCTNCQDCSFTCHHRCFVAYDWFVPLCEIFYLNFFYFKAVCRVCGHGVSRHSAQRFLWQNLVVHQKVTYKSIKMKYKKENEDDLTCQMVLERVQTEIAQLTNDGTQLILKATDQIKQLTSLRNSEEFVDQLIETERQKKKCGYQGRIERLEKAKFCIKRRCRDQDG
ncbi:uncharacterized protein RB166_007060 [Leptodactylus fuscus]